MLRSLATAFLLLAAAAAPGPRQDGGPFIQDEPRQMARVVYFGNAGVSGEYAIEYGKPAWKAEYDKDFAGFTRGKRIRLGKDWWTALNTFCPLVMAEKVELKPGEYFLALECSDKGDWSLIALDPEPIRKARVDAFGSAQTKGGIKVPLKYETAKDSSNELSIRFLGEEKNARQQTLEIRFGKHRLTTIVQPKI